MAIRDVYDKVPLSICLARNRPEDANLYAGLIAEIRQLQRDDWDAVIAITGPEGSGKSALAVNMARDIDNDVVQNLKKHIVYDGQELKSLVFSLPPSAIVVDEGGLDFFSRDALDKNTKELVKMVMIMRMQNMVPIVVLPNLRWLDTYLREHRIKTLIKVWTVKQGIRHIRGFATVYRAKRGDFSKGTYWEPIFDFTFPDFPAEIRAEYMKLKKDSMLERMYSPGQDQLRDYVKRANGIRLKKGQTRLYQGQIADIFGVTQPRISQILTTLKDNGGEIP